MRLHERENGYLLSFQKMYVLRRNVESSSVLENYSFYKGCFVMRMNL